MAVNKGSFTTATYEGRGLLFSWEIKEQSVADNTTTIKWSLKGTGKGAVTWYEAGNFKVVIAGETVYSSATRIKLYEGTVVASGEKKLIHNVDGTKSFSASAEAGIYYVAVNCRGSSSWELTPIARVATITSAPNFNDEENPTISYSIPENSPIEKVEACISITGYPDVLYREISQSATSYTFELTEAERETLRGLTTTSTTSPVKFYLRTTINGETYLSNVSKTLTIINCAPTLNPTIKDTHWRTPYLTGDENTFINHYNEVEYNVGATALKGATIVETRAYLNKNFYWTAANRTFTNYEFSNDTDVFTFKVTDSRGITTTKTLPRNVINYVPITCNIDVTTPAADGTATITIKGNYFNGSFGIVNNYIKLQYRYKTGTADYENWVNTTGTVTFDENGYTYSEIITGLNYEELLTFQARAFDEINTMGMVSAEIQTKGTPVYDWSKEDFNFNVPVNLGGTTVLRKGESNNNLILSTEDSAGGIYLRPNGTNSEEGQVRLLPDGRLNIGGFVLADFITEQGVSGVWTYEKWANGKAVCYGTLTSSHNTATGSTNIGSATYYATRATSFPSGLFIATPLVLVTANDGGTGVATAENDSSTNTNCKVTIWGAETALDTVNVMAIGKWKY